MQFAVDDLGHETADVDPVLAVLAVETHVQVGSPTITRFIEKTQPLLGCSGHIHESPYQPGGKWAARVGLTLWFQPGQEGQKLHYVSLDISDDFSIPTSRHGVFGAAAI